MKNNRRSYTWDHSVHYVNDLQEAVHTFQERGVHVFPGGSHKLWGTHNALGYFGLTYLEFIAVEDIETVRNPPEQNLVAQSALDYLPEHEALSRVAIRTNDLDATAASLAGRGLELSAIKNGSRTDASGNLIEWRMLTIDGSFDGLPYPFFIEWKENDTARLEAFLQKGILEHPAGEITLAAAVFHVTNPEKTALHWQDLFGLEAVQHDSEVHLILEDKAFIFREGSENALTEIHFHTDADDLKGTAIRIGEGKYVFLEKPIQ